MDKIRMEVAYTEVYQRRYLEDTIQGATLVEAGEFLTQGYNVLEEGQRSAQLLEEEMELKKRERREKLKKILVTSVRGADG